MSRLIRNVVIVALFVSVGILHADSNWNVPYGSWSDTNNWAELVVPSSTDSVYIANSGTSVVSVVGNTCKTLYLGYNTSATGTLYMTGGTLTNEINIFIAYSIGSYGEFNQSGGTNLINSMLNMAYNRDAVAVYKISGGSFVVNSDCYIGRNYGDANFYQSGDSTVQIKGNNFLIGWYNGATGYYQQTNGYLKAVSIRMGCNATGNNGKLELFNTAKTEASSARIGETGYGEVNMYDSSEFAVGAIYVGSNAGSTGVVNLVSGSFVSNGRLYIGNKGNGTFNLGNASTTGQLGLSGSSGGDLYVGYYATATGTLNGWGNVNYKTRVRNNGRIIANGYAIDRTLDLSACNLVENDIDNTTDNGWFAIDKGQLVLSDVTVSGTQSYNWGEASADTSIDLVNSVRIDFVDGSGDLTGKLLASDRTDVPEGLENVIGAWSFSGVTLTSATLNFRYDDALAVEKGLSAEKLAIYQFIDGSWVRVTDSVDDTNKIITTKSVSTLSIFAVAAAPAMGSIFIVK